jgi:hypothetical protein
VSAGEGQLIIEAPCGYGCAITLGGTYPLVALNAVCPRHGKYDNSRRDTAREPAMTATDPDPMDEFEDDLDEPWAGGDEDGAGPAGN